MPQSRISVSPKVHFGQPCIAGTRVPVYAVLELLEAEIPFARIVSDYYPGITEQDVKACIRYAIDLIKSEEVHLAEDRA